MKKLLPLLIIICLLISCGSNKTITANTTVYYVQSGHVYHISRDCPTLSRSKTILSGTPAQAKENGKTRLCEVCGKGFTDETTGE